MAASALRFEAIMAQAPEALVALKTSSKWGGSFFNWNDDYSQSGYDGARGPALWAWRTSLVKWISQTGLDGACHLPTLALVEAAAATCGERGRARDGEIQGCQARP